MSPSVDLVIVFRSQSNNKQEALDAAAEYKRLISTLKSAGLRATGKKGSKNGQLLVFVKCLDKSVYGLLQRETARDFLYGLVTPTPELRAQTEGDTTLPNITPANRVRLVHSFITSSKDDGGLGIVPNASGWTRIESVMALHDPEFNDKWLRGWTSHLSVERHLDTLREQFGESLALYFAFLSFYTQSLIIPSILGIFAYLFLGSYSTIYSILLLAWSITTVEWWRIKERKLAVKWGVRGAAQVEKIRAEYVDEGEGSWWKREIRVVASLPVIAVFASALSALITAIFVLEAFVMQLYEGPGRDYISFLPTILFILLVPRLLAFYQSYAVRFTRWENHAHQSSYDRSLTLKTFALAGLVAYGGLALSAFVYVPFGAQVMTYVQQSLSSSSVFSTAGFVNVDKTGASGVRVIQGLKAERLRNQVFAYTATNQVVGFVLEVVLPWVTKFIKGVDKSALPGGKKKRVDWEDEKGENSSGASMTTEDRAFLGSVRSEVALADYQLFGDYAEMVTQFGYVVLWSSCWPLAPLMAMINNVIELRSDAFKISNLGRRPIPSRTDTVGAWLESLSFITWIGALTNAALVFLFNPTTGTFASNSNNSTSQMVDTKTVINASAYPSASSEPSLRSTSPSHHTVMFTALLVALSASHVFLAIRVLARHILERALWRGSVEERAVERDERGVKDRLLKEEKRDVEGVVAQGSGDGAVDPFWEDEEGFKEIDDAGKTE